jgi:signal transduction histidine kinase/ligand-binding sensor domain-containing protein
MLIACLRQLSTIALCVLLTWCPAALALDAALDVSQYGHSAWKIREGFPKSYVYSMAQTPDGYLWLGTVTGLFRFDGVRGVSWMPPAGEQLPSNVISQLFVAHDGRLWIGTAKGLVSWKAGTLTRYPELDGLAVTALLEERQGTIQVGAISQFGTGTGRLCEIRMDGTHCVGEDGSIGVGVFRLYEDKRSDLWAAGQKGVWHWKPGPPRLYPITDEAYLFEGDDGELSVLSRSGIRRIIGGEEKTYVPWRTQTTPTALFLDRDGGRWIGTLERGLLHVHQGRTDAFGRADGLSGDWVKAICEDLEGNVWVATLDGLDRFRDVGVATLSVKQGLSNGSVSSVLAATDGSVWVGTYDGLNRWANGQLTIYRKRNARPASSGAKPESVQAGALDVLGESRGVREIADSGLADDYITSLFQDERGRVWAATRGGLAYFKNGRFVPIVGAYSYGWINSFAGDGYGNLWLSHQGGLLRLLNGTVVERMPWATIGRAARAQALLFDSSRHGLWLGFPEGGLAFLEDGRVRASFAAADGLGEGIVSDLQLDADGALWASTQGGLSRVNEGRVATLTTRNGLPCDAVHSALPDSDRSFWLYTACGLVRIERTELDAWIIDPKRRIHVTVFDASDGVRSGPFTSGAHPIFTKTGDGKVWFQAQGGVSVFQPRNLPTNKLAPPVQVEQVVADRKTYEATSLVKLPPLVRDLQIDYTALSFVAPEKVLFRYRLDGRDRDWQNAGNRRQAFYSDLDPGNYRFRVIAANNSGVWNEKGASLDFSIAPAYWQTNWFRALCVAAFLALLWALYRLRLRQIAQGFNARLEERVGERTRIARDLHDTLLQSFQGLLLRFQTVYELLPTRPTHAREILGSAIDQTAQAINEGRDAVQGLRASTIETNDLAIAITRLGEELAAEAGGQTSAGMRVEVEGEPRTLQPIVRDEVYRIASEALRNAFRHAEAKQIEVELHYDGRQLRLRIRDDGKGIDREYLSTEGRAGHFGLHGMRERAKLMGGKLTVWTAPGSGTEIELSVPAAHAYVASAAPGRSWLAEKFSGKSAKVES